MAASHATTFKAGQILFEVGAPVERIHFLVSGVCSATVPLSDGSAVEVQLIGHEGVVGLLASAGPLPSLVRHRAETDGTAITVPSAAMTLLIADRPELRSVIGLHVGRMIAELAHCAACNAVHKLEQRLAKCLLRFQDRLRTDELTLTQEQMSRMLGVSRTTLNAVAQGLQAEGVLRYSRGRIGILDREQLKATSCECYREPGSFREG